jgi:microsomal dipeptidase-like Zn-dependent dipeptidase
MNRFYPIHTAQQLQAFNELHERNRHNITAALLGIEGLHCLEGDIGNVRKFFDAGVRMMGVAHFFDNEGTGILLFHISLLLALPSILVVGGSAHGERKYGLTPFGREVIAELDRLGAVIDLAHSAPLVIDDVLALSKRPVVFSHTGVQAVCPGPRNLNDKHVRAVIERGGLLSVAFFRPAICGDDDLQSIVATMRHIKELGGLRSIALGSDFDGSVQTPFDITGLPYLVQSMRNAQFTDEEIALIMGGNAKRFWLENLPK